MDEKTLIEHYLKLVRKCIDENRFTMEKEDKRNLTQLGMSFRDAMEVIKFLNTSDYVNGPLTDHIYSDQDVYIFGCDFEGIEIYIKLTFKRNIHLFILSFHEAKYPLTYPYKEEES